MTESPEFEYHEYRNVPRIDFCDAASVLLVFDRDNRIALQWQDGRWNIHKIDPPKSVMEITPLGAKDD